MMRKLSLSKETLRILDDEELALVAGGAGDPSHGNGQTGASGQCNATHGNGHGQTGASGQCNATHGSNG
jgi:hypothetical protein